MDCSIGPRFLSSGQLVGSVSAESPTTESSAVESSTSTFTESFFEFYSCETFWKLLFVPAKFLELFSGNLGVEKKNQICLSTSA